MASTADPAFSNNETKLVARAIKGDDNAFGVLYRCYMEPIYRYIFLRVGNAAEAEDLTEDVFVKAWEALPGYRITEHPFKSWLYRIAHNLVIDYHRKRKPLALADEELQEDPATPPLPEDVIVLNQEAGVLAEAVQRLGEEEQLVVVLRFVDGLSHKEVAEIIGKSEAASRVIQHRALAMLNKHLGG
ncbi:MAG: sigma-70 family RNA polymerase sigma factor [Anaerolineae bacterium]|nr:sigma-70 family RNA polymerase sigma factor [Anaerolineae bacterium]